MAVGTIVTFNETLVPLTNGTILAASDVKIGLITAGTPTAADTTPTWSDYSGSEAVGGTYTTGGTSLGAISAVFVANGTGVMMDSTTNPTWAADGSNSAAVTYGIIYEVTGDLAIAFIELGTVNMQTSTLTITWDGTNGLFKID